MTNDKFQMANGKWQMELFIYSLLYELSSDDHHLSSFDERVNGHAFLQP